MTPELTQPQPKAAKRSPKRICLAAIVVITTIIACFIWSLQNSRSIDERLAQIEAARAIPDSENAAVLYNKLMQTPNAADLVDAWIKEKQPVIDALLEATKFAKCRFPIEMPLPASKAMRNWTFLLKQAANDDIANGRIDDAIEKWRCLLQIGNHLRQQPLFDAHLVAIAIEAVALKQTTAFLVQGNPDEVHLRKIESLPLHTKDNWAAALKEITPAEELAEAVWKGQMSFTEQIKYTFGYDDFGRIEDRDIPKIRRQYHELLARSRGLHVLVALRRYKNKHARWPENLDQIKSQVPAEMFLDPFANTLAYKLTEDTFTLYSKGPNKIDENGKRHEGRDDCPIWIPKTPKKQEQKTDNK